MLSECRLARFGDLADTKVVRLGRSEVDGRVYILTYEYLIGTSGGIRHLTGRHELGLFSREEYETAFRQAGLDVVYIPSGVSAQDNRGGYVGFRDPS